MIAQECLSEALLNGARDVFEKMVFLPIEESPEASPLSGEDVLLGSITFKNDIEGCLDICCNPQCGRAIAVNMLGLPQDSQISEEEINDAVGEVTNMVMGSVKSNMQNELQHLQVSIPVVMTGQNMHNSLGEGTQRASVRVVTPDNHTIELTLLYRESRK